MLVTVSLGLGQRRSAPPGHSVAVLLAQAARRVLGQRVAVALPVGSPHERGDDLDVPLLDLRGFPPEVREAEVDVELEQVDAAWQIGHGKSVETGSDGMLDGDRLRRWARSASAPPRCRRRRPSRTRWPTSARAATTPASSGSWAA